MPLLDRASRDMTVNEGERDATNGLQPDLNW